MKVILSAIVLLAFICPTNSVGDRALTFHNNCPQPVWISATGGFTQNCVNNNCPAGQGCLSNRQPPGCFWTLPNQNFQLSPGQKTTTTLSAPPQGGVKWSGNVYGKTGCNAQGANCETADCGQCGPGQGPFGPTTLVEFTFLQNGPDTYDISLINGVNLAIELGPTPGQNLPPPGGDYWCGNPGGSTPNNGALSGCSWNFDTTVEGQDLSSFLYVVSPGGAACNSQRDCTSPNACGLSITTKQKICGKRLGYWTADQVCGGTNFGAPFNCNSNVPGQGTNANLYGCSGANSGSCYQNNAPTNCCGCPKWVVNGKPVPSGIACKNSNPFWQGIAEPYAAFVKNACPTGYSFPYDDATSTFQCGSRENPNVANYTITYCP